VDSTALAVFRGKINAQRMFRSLWHEIVARYIVDRIVPAKMQPRIIIAIVRFAVPIARQSDGVRSFVEASIADQLRGQSALHSLVHEFVELAIKHRAYRALDLIRMDINACGRRSSPLLREKHRIARKINTPEKEGEP
jgi:hypothetical protein